MAKTGLGRGLGALLGGQKPPETAEAPANPPAVAETVPANAVREVSIGSVQPCPSQPRKDFERQPLEELAASIEVNGILQPLVARTTGEGQLELIAGCVCCSTTNAVAVPYTLYDGRRESGV